MLNEMATNMMYNFPAMAAAVGFLQVVTTRVTSRKHGGIRFTQIRVWGRWKLQISTCVTNKE